MAELHRRILRLPNRDRVAIRLAVFVALLAVASPARADDPTLDDLLAHAEALRSDQADARERAYRALSTLPEEALPAIAERLRQTRRQEIPQEDGYDALRFFRHATGSLRADDMTDIAPGILPVLEERRTAIVGRTAERLLYMRSLEAIGTLEAQQMIGDILALTSRMWRWERRRLVERHGVELLPGLIVLRNHPESPVRVWARWAVEELEMSQPADALQQEDPMLVARILEAYGVARDMDAMPVVISFVGHPASPIREAARGAMTRYAHNGIWQLREGMRNQLGREADRAWGWERTARELYEGLDAARLAPLDTVLDEGLRAAEAGDVSLASAKLDEVLRAAPLHPRRVDIAHAYLALAEHGRAERFVRRAALLAPTDPQVSAALLALEAEADLARGVLDADAWREAARAGHPRAREVVDDLLDEELPELADAPAPTESELPVGLLVGLLLLVLAALAYRHRRRLRPLSALPTPRLPRRLRTRASRAQRLFQRVLRRIRALGPTTGRSSGAAEPVRSRARRLAKLLPANATSGLMRRVALFRRLVRGQAPPPRPVSPPVSAREVVRHRYGGGKAAKPAPKPKPRIVDVVPPKPEPAEQTAGLDELLLGAATPRPMEPDVTFRSPPPVMDEPRHAAPDLAALVLGPPNEERPDRSSPGTLAAPSGDDTLTEAAPTSAQDTLRD